MLSSSPGAVLCPFCLKHNDLHHPSAGQHGATPVSGSISLCAYCGEIGVFVSGPFGLLLRKPTPQEQAMIRRRPEYGELLKERERYLRSPLLYALGIDLDPR